MRGERRLIVPRSLPPWRSIRGKLNAVFGGLIVLGSALAIAGYVQISQVERISLDVIDISITHDLSQDLAIGLADLQADFRAQSALPNRVTYGAVTADIDDIRSILRALEDRVGDTTVLASELAVVVAETESLQAQIEDFISVDAVESLERDQATSELTDHLGHVRRLYDEFSTDSLALVDSSIVSQAGILATLSNHLMFVGITIMTILVATSFYVYRTIRSIGEVTDTALAVAAGELDRHVATDRKDEIGLLAGAFNSMTDQLHEFIEDLEQRVDRRTAQISDVNATLTEEIAEREHIQQELRRSKDFAETVLNSMTESIAIVDMSDHRIVAANTMFTESTETPTADELPGLACYANLNDRSGPCCPSDHACPVRGVELGQALKSAEYVQDEHRDHKRHIEVSISPILDDSGAVSGVVHVSRDITHRKLAEVALRDNAARLESALQDLGDAQAQLLQAQKLEAIGGLAAGVAHEINTPMQYIGDNTRFIHETFTDVISVFQRIIELVGLNAEQLDPATRSEYEAMLDGADLDYFFEEVPTAIAETLDGVQRVADIVRALKDFSHPGEDVKAPVDINQLVTSTVSVSRNEWKYVAELTTDLDPDLSAVPALSGPLGQALLVIIVNAAQAIAEGNGDNSKELGTITIKTSRDANWATIEVADSGPGIPDDIREKVFEHFFTTKPVGTGSGQGLAIARSIVVNQHEGDMDFTSAVGEGTTFRIRLPIEPAAQHEAA